MKAIPILAFVLTFSSCDQNEAVNNEPIALVEMAATNAVKAVETSDSFEYGSFSRMQYLDDVDVLYDALLVKNERLRNLESSINKLNESVADQENDWIQFKSRNEGYYEAASSYIATIADSTIKLGVEQQLQESQERYYSKREEGEVKWDKLTTQIKRLKDNQIALKIILTIPIIESYQGAKSKSVVDIKVLIDAQIKIVDEMESLLKPT